MKGFLSKISSSVNPKAKVYIKKSFEYLIVFPVCLWIGILFTMVGQYIPSMLGFSVLYTRIFNVVFDTISICIPLFIFSYKDGYRNRFFYAKPVLIASIVVIISQQILASIFNYAPYIAGPAYRLGFLITYGGEQFYSHIQKSVPALTEHLSMTGITILFFIPALVLGEYIGVKQRKRREKQLVEYHKDKIPNK